MALVDYPVMEYVEQGTYGGPPPAYMQRVQALEAGLQELQQERNQRQARFNAQLANQALNASMSPEVERMRDALLNRLGPGISGISAANFVQTDMNSVVPIDYVDPIPTVVDNTQPYITTTGVVPWDSTVPYWTTTTGTSYPLIREEDLTPGVVRQPRYEPYGPPMRPLMPQEYVPQEYAPLSPMTEEEMNRILRQIQDMTDRAAQEQLPRRAAPTEIKRTETVPQPDVKKTPDTRRIDFEL